MSEQAKIEIVAAATAGTEYSYAIPANASEIAIGLRNEGAQCKYAWATGDIAGGNYVSFRGKREINTQRMTGKTLFFTSDQASDSLEVDARIY